MHVCAHVLPIKLDLNAGVKLKLQANMILSSVPIIISTIHSLSQLHNATVEADLSPIKHGLGLSLAWVSVLGLESRLTETEEDCLIAIFRTNILANAQCPAESGTSVPIHRHMYTIYIYTTQRVPGTSKQMLHVYGVCTCVCVCVCECICSLIITKTDKE